MGQQYDRCFNFSAGPSTLPLEVLEEIRDDLMNWQGCGMSVLELSHRGKNFDKIITEAEDSLRTLLNVPASHKILFLQGGATLQNTMVPMNLLPSGATADYIVTGFWGSKTLEAAKRAGSINVLYDGKETNYDRVPNLAELNYTKDAAYVHYTSSETVHGVQFVGDPDLPVPAVCDMSSDIISRPMDVAKYGVIYAGAQKNMGAAGVTVVIIREDLLKRTPENFHPMLDYRLHAEHRSIYNTPPCFAIYVCGLIYKWAYKQGGLSAIEARNKAKVELLYRAIDTSDGFFMGHAQRGSRSVMNVTFRLPSEELTEAFLQEAKANRFSDLKGHRAVGGIRASIYNAFPKEGCEALASLMRDFACKNG